MDEQNLIDVVPILCWDPEVPHLPATVYVALADLQETLECWDSQQRSVSMVYGEVFKGCPECKQRPEDCVCGLCGALSKWPDCRVESAKPIRGPELREVTWGQMVDRLLGGRN